jgi:hypothetical protein
MGSLKYSGLFSLKSSHLGELCVCFGVSHMS